MAHWVGESGAAEARAAGRAQWLAELAGAIEHAQLLLWDLAAAERGSAETRALYGELESVRAEIDHLRGAAPGDAGNHQLDEWLAMRGAGGLPGAVRLPAASPRPPKTR